MTANPKTRIEPTEVAKDTFLLHNHQGEGTAPVAVALNAMVIRSREPVVVDTGAAENQEQFLHDVFSVVDPDDIRWVFISHDDVDHTGNLNALLAACPNATAVINWFMVERMGASLASPPTRWRWIGDNDTLDIGDRVLRTLRPPVFDSPTTRGLYDPTTGLYWASDSFATPMTTPVPNVAELDHDFWADGMVTFNHYISPWLDLVDIVRYERTVKNVAALQPTVIAGCHTPAVTGQRITEALDITRRTPSLPYPPQPDQAVLNEIQRTLEAA